MAGLQLHRPATALGLLLITICLAYANSFDNGWHYDDVHTITENPHIRSLADPVGFFTDRTRFARDADKAMFRPLLLLSFALNYHVSGLETWSYHVVNLLIHMSTAMLFWALLRQLGRSPGVALLGAALFGLHPLATEPVNYISSRSESLAALFVMATLVCHKRAGDREFDGWRLASAASFVAAMLSKEVGITALGLVILHDVTRGRLVLGEMFRRLRPAHGLYLALAIGYLVVQSGHVNEAVIDRPVRDGLTQFMTQAKALVYYVRLLMVPRGLSVHHQFFEGGLWLVVATSLLAVVSLAWIARRSAGDVAFGLGWCLTILSPTLVVPLYVLVNDHRLYLPIAGLLVALTSVWMDLGRMPVPRRLKLALSVGALLVMGVLTQNRNTVWADEYTLWSDAAAKSPRPLVPVAYVHLGNYAKEHGALPEAVAYYRRALEIAPEHVAARNNLGLVFEAQGNMEDAAAVFADLAEDRPQIDEAWYNLGNVMQEIGLGHLRQSDAAAARDAFVRAQAAYRAVSDTSFHHHLALNNIGTTFERLDRVDSASVYYRLAMSANPESADAVSNLRRLSARLADRAAMMIEARRFTELKTLCDQLQDLPDAPPEALFYAAVSRFYLGEFEESLAPNQLLIERYPDFALGYLQLGNALETLGKRTDAHAVYERMLDRHDTGPLAEEARRRLRVGVDR